LALKFDDIPLYISGVIQCVTLGVSNKMVSM